jgi:hypothetical protein
MGGILDNNKASGTWAGNVNQWVILSLGGDGFYCLVNYDDPDVVYAEYQKRRFMQIYGCGEQHFLSIVPSEMAGDRINWSMPIRHGPLRSRISFLPAHTGSGVPISVDSAGFRF